jgi:O-antigen/teichoic acid export membrane protein
MSLKRNLIANYLGQGWVALMGIVFVPLYVKALGAESYGLVGVFSILQASLTLLDFGLTPTLSREMSRLQAGAHTAETIRDLVRSLEFIYLILAVAMITSVWFAAGWLALHWLKSGVLPTSTIVGSIRLMGFVLAMRWVEQVYRGALIGVQDQVWLNAAQAALATIRWGGALFVVIFVSPSIIAFFLWQGAVSFITAAALVQRTYRMLPIALRPGQFRFRALAEVRGFASGMFLGAILSFTLMQADKIIMSKLLPLDQLGYYMLAVTLSGGLLQLTAPMNNAIYPRLTVQVTSHEYASLERTYLQACEWMAAIIVPPALLMTFFAGPVLLAWTGDEGLTRSTATLLALLALGTLFNGLMNLPYLLQIAHGWTSLTAWKNVLASALVVPALLWAIPRYEAVGAASVWLALNLGYLLLEPMLVFRRLLTHCKWRWYRSAVVAPVASGGMVAALLAYALPIPTSRLSAGVIIVIATISTYGAVLLVLPNVRDAARRALAVTWWLGADNRR